MGGGGAALHQNKSTPSQRLSEAVLHCDWQGSRKKEKQGKKGKKGGGGRRSKGGKKRWAEPEDVAGSGTRRAPTRFGGGGLVVRGGLSFISKRRQMASLAHGTDPSPRLPRCTRVMDVGSARKTRRRGPRHICGGR